MAAFRDAQARGMDLDRGLPALVQGRTVAGADDITAVLHGAFFLPRRRTIRPYL